MRAAGCGSLPGAPSRFELARFNTRMSLTCRRSDPVTRWEAFNTLCRYLRAGFLKGECYTEQEEVSWELLIEIASFHYVTPAISWCLNDRDIPADVRDYFSAMAALNGKRNGLMLSGLERIAGILNAVDIEPMLLKGAAMLAEELYPDPSLRFLGDLDILITAERSADAVAALTAAGFETKPSDVLPPPQHHHLPMLHDPETGAGLELHTRVMPQSADAVIATDWFCENARPAIFRRHRIRLPDATRNAAHIIYHSEIFHGLYWLNKVQLRHLLDLAVIRARHEETIDWEEIDQRFSAAGFGEVLATYLDFAEKLFGQTAPKLRHAPNEDAMEDMCRLEMRDGFHVQIERLKDGSDRLQTELSQTLVKLERMTADRDSARHELGRMTVGRDSFQDELGRMTPERDWLRAELARMTAARDKSAEELGRLHASRNEALKELQGLTTSKSWRWTAPLRAFVRGARRLTKIT